MKRLQISTRAVEMSIGLLATALIAAGLLPIMLLEPQRQVAAQQAQLAADLDSAMTLYAENCAVCHGLAGEGIGATPPLDVPALREAPFDMLEKTIARGLYNTAMPAWSQSDGGPLSAYQVGELASLIQLGDWQQVQDRVVNLGLTPQTAFASEPDPQILAALADQPEGAALAQGVALYGAHCVACHGADGLGSALAPPLNDAELAAQPPEELTRIVSLGVAGSLMAGWDQRLGSEEIVALVHLMQNWDQVPSGAIPAPERDIPVTAESLALGADLYAANCAHCHADEGQGTPRAPALNVQSFLTATNDGAIEQIILSGVPGTAMPSWGDRLTTAEIQAVVGFVRAWEPDAPAVAETARGGPRWSSGQPGNGGGQPGSAGQGQGPPWLRDNSAQPANPLPGGGQSLAPDAGGSLDTSTPVAASAGEAATHAGNGQSQTPNHGGSTGTRAPAAGSAGEPASHAGGGPPWAQTAAAPPEEEPWDARILLLFGGGGALSLGLTGWGLIGLQRTTRRAAAPDDKPQD